MENAQNRAAIRVPVSRAGHCDRAVKLAFASKSTAMCSRSFGKFDTGHYTLSLLLSLCDYQYIKKELVVIAFLKNRCKYTWQHGICVEEAMPSGPLSLAIGSGHYCLNSLYWCLPSKVETRKTQQRQRQTRKGVLQPLGRDHPELVEALSARSLDQDDPCLHRSHAWDLWSTVQVHEH